MRFDIDADGLLEQVSWTRPGARDAFLFLDRNGNGIVDGGWELFGDRTSQPPSATPNGYAALAVLDGAPAEGNGDGIVSAADHAFPWLRLWVDGNHDGASQPHELLSLAQEGIESIDLDYVLSERRDRHGNRFRYKSSVRTAKGTVHSVDVFLQVAEGPQVAATRAPR